MKPTYESSQAENFIGFALILDNALLPSSVDQYNLTLMHAKTVLFNLPMNNSAKDRSLKSSI